ncbi:protein kinase domain-containing protein [Sporosarcina obsidiansis]|uniref:protein kinase domain-containing protein n=1 Tax=Sporosarcina obsidiansis TaxID=2660748 RepID=UPI001891F22E|nr:protein kinase [Sporosarcina obsidiansis]
MALTISNNEVYLKNKLTELTNKFGREKIALNIDFYNNFPTELQQLFSLFHYHLNDLLKYMNQRISNGRYTAHESRELIFLIDQLKTIQANLKNTDLAFDIDNKYKDTLNECESFLSSSGGSEIPNNFSRINIIENRPIFNLSSDNSITIDNSIQTLKAKLKLIGEGSYAKVFKYKDPYYNEQFAIKRALSNLTAQEYERFELEYQTMKNLNSPYILKVYRFDQKEKQYTMEYANETLFTFIEKNNSNLSITTRINLIRQTLRAFEYIHSKGLLHRDISPTNILIQKFDGLNIIKISDFGLVKYEDSNLTRINTELKGHFNDHHDLSIIGFKNYKIHHETFALTRIIYFVLTGRKNIQSVKNKDFEIFIKRGISSNIYERYRSVDEIQKHFNQLKHYE